MYFFRLGFLIDVDEFVFVSLRCISYRLFNAGTTRDEGSSRFSCERRHYRNKLVAILRVRVRCLLNIDFPVVYYRNPSLKNNRIDCLLNR